MSGPLSGIKVLEVAGLGPGPFCGMLLSDLGAEVIRLDRVDRSRMFTVSEPRFDVLARGRSSVAVDLRDPRGAEVVLRLAENADALFEGMRPGVAERLGIGPDECLARNPGLVYGRMTGWGQDGPWAGMAGHDIDYIALTGILHTIGGRGQPPTIPLNLVGDFGGGGLMLAFGIVCALLEAKVSGRGQVVDAAMVDGASTLGAMIFGLAGSGAWTPERGTNLLDGGTPFYNVYETSDGEYMAVGAIEPQFYATLLDGLAIPAEELADQWDIAGWPSTRERIATAFRARSRDEWTEVFAGSDACVAPILSMWEAPTHPHMESRRTLVDLDGVTQPAPAPRFSRTPGSIRNGPVMPGNDTERILSGSGFSAVELSVLREDGVIA